MTILILLIIGGLSNAVMDISSEGTFIFKWWNKNQSWENKHNFNILGFTLPKKLHVKPVKLLLKYPLVFLTDGWHFAQFVFHTSWQLALAILVVRDKGDFLSLGNTAMVIGVCLVIVKFIFSVSFTLIYDYMKIKPEHKK